VVKIVGSPSTATRLRALYFTRATAPWGEGPHYHHIGLYAYRRAALAPLADTAVDIGTLGVEISREEERTNPNVVKIVGAALPGRRMRALYFTRATAPWGEGPHYHHIGLYAYRRAALERFVGLPPSPLEMREKLEQLRAVEAGMRIDVEIVSSVPLGVDTPEDLERARQILTGKA
jgi:3-deoxy-manno-octulosonate cytidylyltransferase (CMP-KDO synthetase)